MPSTLTISAADTTAPTSVTDKTPTISEGGITDNLQLLKDVSDASSVTLSKIGIGSGTAAALSTTLETSGQYVGFSKFSGTHGDLYVRADGTAYYQHDGEDPSGSSETDAFTFVVSDGTNETTKDITVTINAVDDTAPTITADTATAEVGSSVVFDGGTGNEANLLTNDTGSSAVFSVNGVEYDSLTNSDHSTYGSGYKKVVATFGTLFIKEDGDAAYVHSGSSGSDQDVFIYEVTDAVGNVSVPSTLTISAADTTAPTSVTDKTPTISEGGITDNLQLLKDVSDASSVTLSKIGIGSGTAAALSTTLETSGQYVGFSKFSGTHGDLYVRADGTAYYQHDGEDRVVLRLTRLHLLSVMEQMRQQRILQSRSTQLMILLRRSQLIRQQLRVHLLSLMVVLVMKRTCLQMILVPRLSSLLMELSTTA